ncbi:uncharacterized protein LOC133196351 [Saccostrea echinata]|uniref:uncharacterized protein LOC133196351 n=1 Tax=Saccostrea echinata TaxID=191078 RepID=UPI002A83D50D|nr:uncharacterized protein LOC133196351 [Saccostrea echinata]
MKKNEETSPLLRERQLWDSHAKEAWTSGKTGKFRFQGVTRNVILAILNVFSNVTMNVSLPVFAGTMDEIGGDAFVLLLNTCFVIGVLFVLTNLFAKCVIDKSTTFRMTSSIKIIFALGLFTALNGILVVFASPPNRTPGYLQGILSTTTIPFTIICRLIFLRKGISVIRALCTCLVMAGLFITAEPQIFGINSADDSNTAEESTSARILWPLCFALGFLPIGIMNVICEKELKNSEAKSFNFIMWSQFTQIICMACLFWTDFIPGFGMASSFSEFSTRYKKGTTCLFSTSSDCKGLIGKSWIFFGGYTFGNLFQFLLIEYAEGAVFAAVVQSLVGPIASIFWTFFEFNVKENVFRWHPVFNETTAFTLIGLLLMVPGVMLYNYFSNKEAKNAVRECRDLYTDPELKINNA